MSFYYCPMVNFSLLSFSEICNMQNVQFAKSLSIPNLMDIKVFFSNILIHIFVFPIAKLLNFRKYYYYYYFYNYYPKLIFWSVLFRKGWKGEGSLYVSQISGHLLQLQIVTASCTNPTTSATIPDLEKVPVVESNLTNSAIHLRLSMLRHQAASFLCLWNLRSAASFSSPRRQTPHLFVPTNWTVRWLSKDLWPLLRLTPAVTSSKKFNVIQSMCLERRQRANCRDLSTFLLLLDPLWGCLLLL